MTKVIIAMLVIVLAILSIRVWAEKLRCKAIIYYLVEKECTAPTKEDVERCIKIVVEKTVNKGFKRGH